MAHLPHLNSFQKTPVVFLTVCMHERRPLLANPTAHKALREIWTKSAALNGWFVGHYLLMPDHVHFFAAATSDARSLPAWTGLWKSLSAKKLNRAWQLPAPFWQADYFDRYVRSLREYEEKWAYIEMNPVRKGLVSRPEDWPYRGTIHDLRHHASRGW